MNHTGAHKINNCIGPNVADETDGKTRIIARTGGRSARRGSATAAALFGLPCRVYMGEETSAGRNSTYSRCEHWGPKCIPFTTGSRTLRDAINEAMREWMATVATRTTSSAAWSARTRSR